MWEIRVLKIGLQYVGELVMAIVVMAVQQLEWYWARDWQLNCSSDTYLVSVSYCAYQTQLVLQIWIFSSFLSFCLHHLFSLFFSTSKRGGHGNSDGSDGWCPSASTSTSDGGSGSGNLWIFFGREPATLLLSLFLGCCDWKKWPFSWSVHSTVSHFDGVVSISN